MSLIVGQYYRGDHKQKPKQWGSSSTVATVLKERISNIGLQADKLVIAMPMWEKAGAVAINYANTTTKGSLSGATFSNDGVLCDESYECIDTQLTVNELFFVGATRFTLMFDYQRTVTSDYFYLVTSYPYSSIFCLLGNFTLGQLYGYFGSSNKNYIGGSATESEYAYDILFDYDKHTFGFSGILDNIPNYILDTNILPGSINIASFAGFSSLDLLIGGRKDSSNRFAGGLIDSIFGFSYNLSPHQMLLLKDNKYQLLQPPTFRTYFDLAETVVRSGYVIDGFNISDAVGKRAIFSATAQENMSLVDMDQNIGNFIAALVDQIEISESTGRTAILNVSSNDSFSFSDAVSSIQKILAIVSDDVNISEVPAVRADMTAIAKDAIEFSESFVATLKATAVINEIINLLDTVSTDALSIITALAADVLNVSDGSLARADFVSAVLENIELSEATINFLAALATTSETINISDSAFWHGIQSAFVADGVSITSTAVSLMTALVTAAESISLDDSGTVKATFNVEINSALQFAETISAIATLRGSISDGINITATPLEISTLPNGKLSVSFSLKTPGVEFDIKTATIVFNLK